MTRKAKTPRPPARPCAAAMKACEDYLGLVLVEREVKESVPLRAEWHQLKERPVSSIEAPRAAGLAIDTDSSGTGWVRFPVGGDGTFTVTYRAGMAADFDGLPEPVKSGLWRYSDLLAANPDTPFPPAVLALWRPYRRLRLS